GKHAESLEQFSAAAKLEPDDDRIAAKVVQCCQALGRRKERDKARGRLFKLHEQGKTERELYCRDQFKASKYDVMALEYFELKGERAVRCSFQVTPHGKDKPAYRISLGSYELTNAIAHEQGTLPKDQRCFHLDRYFPSGKHETFAFYKGEPKYDDVRATVIE